MRIAVLISGSGSTLKNLIALIARGELGVEIGLVVSSSEKADGLNHARDANIPFKVVRKLKEDTVEQFSEKIFSACRDHSIGLVVMGGFIKQISVPGDFENRIINVHPSLIPAFCGQGFYGSRVHQSVIDYGCKISGCTVHFVDNQYDHGPIILQQAVEVHSTDTASDLAARVQKAEREVYPRVIQKIADGNVTINGRTVGVK